MLRRATIEKAEDTWATLYAGPPPAYIFSPPSRSPYAVAPASAASTPLMGRRDGLAELAYSSPLPTPTLTGGIHTNALPATLKALRYRALPYERPAPPLADRRARATAAMLPWSGAAAARRPLYAGRTIDAATSPLTQAAAHPGPARLHAPAQRRTEPVLDELPLAPAEAPASNPENIREASRLARAGRIQACGLHAALDATAREEVITTSAQDAEKRLMASCDLIDTLPAYCLAHVCEVPEARLQYLEASRVVAHFLWMCKKWKSVDTIYQARLSWAKFLVYMQALDDPLEDLNGWISLLVLTEYGAQYHAQAVANAATRAGRRGPAAAGRKAGQSGETAADKQMENLAFLARNFGLRVPAARVPSFRTGTVARNPPQSARPISLRMTIALEAYVARPDISEVMANVAGALLFCIFGGHRVRQAQCQTWFYEHQQVLFGSCDDKSGSVRRTFTPLNGIRLGDKWFRRLQETLQGVENGGFVFREFSSPTGKADHPAAFLVNAPRAHEKIMRDIQLVLREACSFLSPQDVLSFTLHSARHTIQEIGKGRREGVDARVELGRWAHSTAAADASPAARAARARLHIVGVMPDLYASESRVLRVCSIMTRQWGAVAMWLAHSYGGNMESLPAHGGWEEVPCFNSACEVA
jgi:hypothetical protein